MVRCRLETRRLRSVGADDIQAHQRHVLCLIGCRDTSTFAMFHVKRCRVDPKPSCTPVNDVSRETSVRRFSENRDGARAVINSVNPQLSQRFNGPAIAFGRLTDDRDATRSNQSRPQLQRPRRWPKPSRHCRIDDLITRSDHRLDVGAQHRHSIAPTQTTHYPVEKVRPLGTSIDQDKLEIWSVMGDHQTRDTTA